MKLSTCSILLAAGLAFTGCDSLPTVGDLNPMGGASAGGGAASLKDIPAMNVMTLPKNAAVGQFWEVEMSGMTTRNAIVDDMGGKFIVEQTSSMREGVIEAFLVDPTVDMMRMVEAGDKMNANVTGAWVGDEGEAPMERKVMDAMVMPEMPAVDAPAVESTEGVQTVNMAGRDWDTKWIETSGSKMWTDNATGIMVRMDYNGDTMSKVTAYGTDAKPALDWTK